VAPLEKQAWLDKSTVYSKDAASAASAASVARNLGIRHAPEGLLAAASPVGTPSFQATQASSYADHACHLIVELLALLLGDQDRWLILHGSPQKQLAHLPRACKWSGQVGEADQLVESKAVDSAFAIMALPCKHGILTNQITLPLCISRLCMSRTDPAKGIAIFLAAAATINLPCEMYPWLSGCLMVPVVRKSAHRGMP
jgi:hypothetical protein